MDVKTTTHLSWLLFSEVDSITERNFKSEYYSEQAEGICGLGSIRFHGTYLQFLHCFRKTQVTNKRDKEIAQACIALRSIRGKSKMKIDTEIRHVTKPGANLFLELGFSAEEAESLKDISLRENEDAVNESTKQLR